MLQYVTAETLTVIAGWAPSGKVFPELRLDALSVVSVKVSS